MPSAAWRPNDWRRRWRLKEQYSLLWLVLGFIAYTVYRRYLVPFLVELIPTLERHGHLRLTDDRLFDYPWIYLIEPGNMYLEDAEVAADGDEGRA